ncbi:MAG: dihydrolipoyl dehydrogenase [Phycisphaerae bacterium]
MNQHDVVVIGAGPGGYVAAIRAAQLGMNVACIEKEPALGGTCLRVGCIPSKALLESSERYHEAGHEFAIHGIKVGKLELDLAAMLKRKDDVVKANTSGIEMLFKKNKITRYTGHGRIAGAADGGCKVVVEKDGGASEEIAAKKVIIATGSNVFKLPGVEFDWDRVGTSTEALKYPEVPKHLVVIGAGVIGLELGSVWVRLGAKVTVLEYLDRILPGMDTEMADAALKIFKKQGMEFRLSTKVTGARNQSKIQSRRAGTKSEIDPAAACAVEIDGSEPITCDRVLVAVGRVPNTEKLGLESVGIQLDAKGRVPVGDHFETSAAGIFAIGDVIRGPMLAHKAEDEGIACAEYIATGYGHVNYDTVPNVVYTHPELASVGKSEDELKQASVPYRKGVFFFKANGRARALNQTDGWVKVLAHKETDRVLGVHIIGPRGGDLIAEAAVAMEFGASSEDIARACHAHPTLPEALKEAALAVDGRAIHS